jgi:hypothetical protein
MSVKSVVSNECLVASGKDLRRILVKQNSETGYINLMDDVVVSYACNHVMETPMG